MVKLFQTLRRIQSNTSTGAKHPDWLKSLLALLDSDAASVVGSDPPSFPSTVSLSSADDIWKEESVFFVLSLFLSLSLPIHIYIYIYVYMYVEICI